MPRENNRLRGLAGGDERPVSGLEILEAVGEVDMGSGLGSNTGADAERLGRDTGGMRGTPES